MDIKPEIWAAASAFANCVIAVANIVLFVIGFRTLRNDRRRIEKMEAADRRRFADDIYVWIEERSPDKVSIICRNGGSAVVYEVSVQVVGRDGVQRGNRYQIELMKPMEERVCEIVTSFSTTGAGVAVEFRDPAGVRWLRDHAGQLSSIDI